MFPFEGHFSSGETNKKLLGVRTGEQGGWDTAGHPVFWSETAEHSVLCGQVSP